MVIAELRSESTTLTKGYAKGVLLQDASKVLRLQRCAGAADLDLHQVCTRRVQDAYKDQDQLSPTADVQERKGSLAADVHYMLEPQWLRKIDRDPRLALGPTYREQLTVG